LQTLTKQEIQEAYLHILALQEVTVTFDEWLEEQEERKDLEKKYA